MSEACLDRAGLTSGHHPEPGPDSFHMGPGMGGPIDPIQGPRVWIRMVRPAEGWRCDV